MIKNIRREKFYNSSPELLWDALTKSEAISAWLMQTSDFTAQVGRRFVFQAKPMGNWDGKIYGEVLVADRPRKLSYTWKGELMKSTTVLTWTLIPKDGGTLLVLEHTGFSGFTDYILGTFHAMGWGKFLDQLNRYITRD